MKTLLLLLIIFLTSCGSIEISRKFNGYKVADKYEMDCRLYLELHKVTFTETIWVGESIYHKSQIGDTIR